MLGLRCGPWLLFVLMSAGMGAGEPMVTCDDAEGAAAVTLEGNYAAMLSSFSSTSPSMGEKKRKQKERAALKAQLAAEKQAYEALAGTGDASVFSASNGVMAQLQARFGEDGRDGGRVAAAGREDTPVYLKLQYVDRALAYKRAGCADFCSLACAFKADPLERTRWRKNLSSWVLHEAELRLQLQQTAGVAREVRRMRKAGGIPPALFPAAEKRVVLKFNEKRQRGDVVTASWLRSTMRTEVSPPPLAIFRCL